MSKGDFKLWTEEYNVSLLQLLRIRYGGYAFPSFQPSGHRDHWILPLPYLEQLPDQRATFLTL